MYLKDMLPVNTKQQLTSKWASSTCMYSTSFSDGVSIDLPIAELN